MTASPSPVDTHALFNAWAAAEQAAHRLLAPLETEADYDAALTTLELLWEEKTARPELGTLLALLSSRIQAYETRVYPMPDVPAHRVLAFLMEGRGLSQSAVTRATGIDQSNLSRLLSGEREFTTGHMRTLAGYFGVSPAVFL